MISINTLDEAELLSEFGKYVHPLTDSVSPGIWKQFVLEITLMEMLGI